MYAEVIQKECRQYSKCRKRGGDLIYSVRQADKCPGYNSAATSAASLLQLLSFGGSITGALVALLNSTIDH